jgi:digeranylgeranylglycerophospholipid reductase
VGRSPWSLAASGFVVVGDAAGQVIPTTGCGVGAGMIGAMLAAGSIIEASGKNDAGIASLWSYNRRWFAESARGAHLAALGALKNILQDLSHEELAFLIRHDILSGEMLTPAINGVFHEPDLAEMGKTLARGFSRPAILARLNRATSMGKKVYKHYLAYPAVWNPESFTRWRVGAAHLLG